MLHEPKIARPLTLLQHLYHKSLAEIRRQIYRQNKAATWSYTIYIHVLKSTIISLFIVLSAYITSIQYRDAISKNRVEEADANLGGGEG